MTNRLKEMISAVEPELKNVDKTKRARLKAAFALDASEVIGWQNAQAEAHAGGTLSTDEAQLIYTAIGPTGENWTKQTLATQLIVTQVMQTLLGNQIAARRWRASREG
jgi:hypothetical protein